MTALLDARGLGKVFTLHGLGSTTLVGCRDIAFTLEEGRCLALVGTSGAGKSTVLKCIYRTYLPTEGTILYRRADGHLVDLAHLGDRAVLRLRATEIGYVSQFLRVVPRVTALDVVAEPLMLRGVDSSDARRAASAMLERLRLPSGLWDAYPATFSGGERQRVNVARACLSRPRLLLVDEPTASLDAETKRDVVGLLGEMKHEGVAVLAILHDREVVEHLADDVLAMEGGRVCPAIS